MESQISLTASDGTGLEMRGLEAKIVLDGFLALTELTLVFYNPENRQREGRFQMILPSQAAISRLAMWIGNHLQEGEMVEKRLARRAYEDFLHRRQDPALLEMDQGNRFNARIFPIEALSEKVIILSYSQRLYQNDTLLPLKGLPKLANLKITVFYDDKEQSAVQPQKTLTIHQQDYQPKEDFLLPYQVAPNLALENDLWLAAKITPVPAEPAELSLAIETLVVLLDTSASQAPFIKETLKRLQQFMPALKANHLILYTFNQETIEWHSDEPEPTALLATLANDEALGASRLDHAIDKLSQCSFTRARLLLVSDAVITAGETNQEALTARLKTLEWLERLDVLLPSYYSDEVLARYLVTGGKTPGTVIRLTQDNTEIVQQLTIPVYGNMQLTVEGADWFWPQSIDSIQAGESIIVFANRTLREPPKIFVNGTALPLTVKSANPLLLKRECVRARLEQLLYREAKTTVKATKNAVHKEIIELSVTERVLSPYTALLVLETEVDYHRYQIARRGLADILTIGVDGLLVLKPANSKPWEGKLLSNSTRTEVFADEGSDFSLEPGFGNEKDNSSVESTMSISLNKTDRHVICQIAGPRRGMSLDELASEIRQLGGNIEVDSEPGKGTTFTIRVPAPQVKSNGGFEHTFDLLASEQIDRALNFLEWWRNSEKNSALLEVIDLITDEIKSGDVKRVLDLINVWQQIQHLHGQVDIITLTVLRELGQLVNQSRLEYFLNSLLPAKFIGFFVIEYLLRDSCYKQSLLELIRSWRKYDRLLYLTAVLELITYQRAGETQQVDSAYHSLIESFPTLDDEKRLWVVERLLENDLTGPALALINIWHQFEPANVMALIALGAYYECAGNGQQAARAYGSLIDYFPARADIRRWAAERLLCLGGVSWLAIDSLKQAVEQRPDHPTGYYLLAFACWQAGQFKPAIETLQAAAHIRFEERFIWTSYILEDTLALMLSSLKQTGQLAQLFPTQRPRFNKATKPQMRLVLLWETDANEVELLVYDNQGNEASSLGNKNLVTGGYFYQYGWNIRTGYGPECFIVTHPNAFPYSLLVKYSQMGPMGYGMGVVHILNYAADGQLTNEWRPFVLMEDNAVANLGQLNGEF